jgi:hypothetical protein
MTPDEILEVDAKRNYPQGVTINVLKREINRFTQDGGGILQQGKTLVMFRLIGPHSVEFHTFNADTPDNLVKNVETVFKVFRKMQIKNAQTQYDNPAITGLFDKLGPGFKSDIQQTQTGYVAKVSL